MTKRRREQKMSAFTLVEIVVVLTIGAIILSIGLPYTLNMVKNYSLSGDRDVVVSLLERARDQSLANYQQSAHGVEITSSSYVGFEGSSYAARDTAKDLVYPRAEGLTLVGPSEMVFQPVTGATSTSTLTLGNGVKTETIKINQEGMIDW